MEWDIPMRKDTSIALLPITGPQINSLWAARKHILGDLSGIKQSELMMLPSISRKCLDAIDNVLMEADLPAIDRAPLPEEKQVVGAKESEIVARERRKYVALMRNHGMKFREIGEIVGVGPARAAQLFHSHERKTNPVRKAADEHQNIRGFFAPRGVLVTETSVNALKAGRA